MFPYQTWSIFGGVKRIGKYMQEVDLGLTVA